MSQALTTTNGADLVERVVINGDLSRLTPAERVSYYSQVCESLRLNPLTKPFDYITLNGKLTLYARKDCADQLRNRDSISITIAARELVEGVYVVTARATTPNGRTDESIGAVPIEGLKGEAKANAMMKTETKAKRRVTLSICGLGMLDETEITTIPDARPVVVDQRTGEIIDQPKPNTIESAPACDICGALGRPSKSGDGSWYCPNKHDGKWYTISQEDDLFPEPAGHVSDDADMPL